MFTPNTRGGANIVPVTNASGIMPKNNAAANSCLLVIL